MLITAANRARLGGEKKEEKKSSAGDLDMVVDSSI